MTAPSDPRGCRVWHAIAGVAALAVACAAVAGCGAADVTESAPAPSPGAVKALKARCDGLDLVTPNWQKPDAGDRRVGSVATARRITHLPLVLPRGLQRPAAIYVPIAANFVYHGSKTGDVIIVEGKPQLSPAEWQKELKAMPAQNGKPDVTGTARVVDLGDGAKALQTKSPCITGSSTDWYTRDHRMEVVIEAHTASEAVGARIARLTEQAVGQ